MLEEKASYRETHSMIPLKLGNMQNKAKAMRYKGVEKP